MNYKAKLKTITEILLEKEDSYGELIDVVNDLNKLFFDITNLDINKEENREAIYTEEGKAIGTVWAAACVKEFMRTKKFIRGVYYGIKSALEKFPKRPIHILYAGTGPFATLAIPLTSVFGSNEINFTFLEINDNSIEYLKNIIKAFEVEDYIIDIIKCDATKFKIDKNKPFQMIITETMLNGLRSEPQVGITINLVSQMEEDGILIPENIKIEAALLSPKKNMERMMNADYKGDYYSPLDTIFQLNKDTSKLYNGENRNYSFPVVDITIPKDKVEEYKDLSLLTTIKVFDDEILTHHQCSLNLPLKIISFNQENVFEKISFQYQLSQKPSFKYDIS
ncbi:MAG: phytanoyl-CoA dioxygenase [Spirochaetes bacterium GWD1_27_9]|nr:MAG: phytanoyl-CoA dioxygenase [Spirochaetes bacterium GWB1_27_13]OHD35755.1 MAG: phytanoyl-CoA dioxygenase [Spirochaetes bacterium GWD1_27_9]